MSNNLIVYVVQPGEERNDRWKPSVRSTKGHDPQEDMDDDDSMPPLSAITLAEADEDVDMNANDPSGSSAGN